MRPLEELRSSGLLWLINRSTFHPRGYALALCVDADDNVEGWMLEGDGTEPWTFTPDVDDEHFERVQRLLDPVVVEVSDARLASEVEGLRATEQRLIAQADVYAQRVAELEARLAEASGHLNPSA